MLVILYPYRQFAARKSNGTQKSTWCAHSICMNFDAYITYICSRSFAVNFSEHDDVIKWKHFPRYWPFVREIHRSPVNSPHKGQWRGALMFSLICALTNGWANNRNAGDLRRHHAHYDVTVMNRADGCYTANANWNKWEIEKLSLCSQDACPLIHSIMCSQVTDISTLENITRRFNNKP